MNLLDQLELFMLEKSERKVTQREYWLFVYDSMRSGELMTQPLKEHVQYKLRNLGVQLS